MLMRSRHWPRLPGLRLLALGLSALAAAAPLATVPAAAQRLETRDWKGRPIDHACRARPGDHDGLRQALVRHELFSIGFENKLATGWFYGNKLHLAGTKTSKTPGAELARQIATHLAKVSGDLRTAALVYDVGVVGGRATLCVWLLTEAGLEAAETIAVGSGPTQPGLGAFAEATRTSLGVTRAALARSPRPREGGDRALPPATSPAPAAAAPVASPDPAGSADRLAAISERLLPASVRAKLGERRIERLLVLPAADLATVPFYALPFEGRTLLDRMSVVVLGGVDGLLQLVRKGIWGDRFRAGRAKLIVADPDPSDDPLQWSPLDGARSEADAVDKLTSGMKGPLLVRGDATRERVLEHLGVWDLGLAYFATHGIADPTDPLDKSFLLLAGGRFLARDVAGLRGRLAKSPLVVMSACQSGLGKTFEGGTFGLARAWLAAGATQVVTSLWDIGDDSTKDLMADAMRRMIVGKVRPEVALREAMLAARDASRAPVGAWSGFALVGFASE